MTRNEQGTKMIVEKKKEQEKKKREIEEEKMHALGKRIRTVRGKTAQETFAKTLDISRGALSFYERGHNEPSAGTLSKICTIYHVRTSWLLNGTGSMNPPPPHIAPPDTPKDILPTSLSHPNVHENDASELLIVPLVEIYFESKDGTFETSKQEEWNYAFRRSFLEKKGNPEQMIFMRVTGDSMEPDIKDGDIVLIDRQQTQLKAGRIYAVGIEGLVYLKYVDAEPGRIILSSPNKDYKPIILETGEQRENIVRIIGQVISIEREVN